MTAPRDSPRLQDKPRRGPGSYLRLLPLVAVLVATGPLLIWGFPAGHDWGWELVRIVEYREAVATGQLLPFWAVDLYSGWGSPIFLFYAPLFSALASASTVLFGSLLSGTSVVLILMSMISAFLVTRVMGAVEHEDGAHQQSAARVAAYVYTLHPYLLADLLIRNANAEYTALCLLPLVFYGVLRLRDRPAHGALALACGLGLSVLSHNLTALFAMALALIMVSVLYLPARSHRPLTFGAGGLALGLLLTAWFWMPALALTDLVRPELLVEGRYDFHQNFPTFLGMWGFGEYFSAGLLSPLVLVIAALLAKSSRPNFSGRTRRFFWALLGCALLAVALQMAISRPLWEATPLMPLLQFPWRLMGPLALLIATLSGLIFLGLTGGLSRRTVLSLELVVLALCVVNALPQLSRVRSFSAQGRVSIEEGLTPTAIRQGRQSATGMNEYLPRTVDFSAWEELPPGSLLVAPPPDLTVLGAEESGTRLRLELDATQGMAVRLARWYFPGWQARLDGEPVSVGPGPLGELSISIPRGRSVLEVVLEPPTIRRVGAWISAVAVVLFLLALGATVLPWLDTPSSS